MTEIDAGAVLGGDDNYHAIFSGTDEKRYIQIKNLSDGDIYISFDGVENHFRIAAGSSLTLNLAFNKSFWNDAINAKRADSTAPPTTGNVEVSAYA